jgi:uncharacterized membrane protein
VEEVGRKEAIASFVLGIVSLIAWCIPICGAPVTLVGIVLGVRGLQSTSQRAMAIVGIILCSLGLIATLVNAAIGAYLGATGQHPLLQRWQR